MEKSILRVLQILESRLIQIGSVERTILLTHKFLIGSERKVIQNNQNAMDIQGTSSEIRMILLECGHVVEMMQLMAAVLVLKWNISLLNGLMKRLKSTFTISQDDLIHINL